MRTFECGGIWLSGLVVHLERLVYTLASCLCAASTAADRIEICRYSTILHSRCWLLDVFNLYRRLWWQGNSLRSICQTLSQHLNLHLRTLAKLSFPSISVFCLTILALPIRQLLSTILQTVLQLLDTGYQFLQLPLVFLLPRLHLVLEFIDLGGSSLSKSALSLSVLCFPLRWRGVDCRFPTWLGLWRKNPFFVHGYCRDVICTRHGCKWFIGCGGCRWCEDVRGRARHCG